MKPFSFFCFFTTLLTPFTLAGQVKLSESTGRYSVGTELFILEDAEGSLTSLDQVTAPDIRKRFVRSDQKVANRGFSVSDYWIRFDLTLPPHSQTFWYIEIAFGGFGVVDLYFILKQTGELVNKKGGDLLLPNRSELSSPHYLFQIPQDKGSTFEVYGRLSSLFGQATFPVNIWSIGKLSSKLESTGFWWGMYYGVLILIFLYHAALALLTRDKGYVLLCSYLLSYLLYDFSRGYFLGLRYLWPESSWLTENAVGVLLPCTLILFVVFYSHALQFKNSIPGLKFIIFAVALTCVIVAALCVARPQGVSINWLLSYFSTLILTLMGGMGAYSWTKGFKPAMYYFMAVVAGFCGGWIHTLHRQGFFARDNWLLQYSLNFTSLTELLLMALGLAATIQKNRKEKSELIRKNEREVLAAEFHALIRERDRVAEELHTGLGGSLLHLRRIVENKKEGKPEESEELNWIHLILNDVYDEVRATSNNMLSVNFEQVGLTGYLTDLIDRLNLVAPPKFYLLLSGREGQLPMKTQLYLYLICVELTNNIIKHAKASEASIRLVSKEDSLIMFISDNGVGITSEKSFSGSGLRQIRNRLNDLNGRIDLLQIEEGCSLKVSIPFTLDQY